MKKIFALLACFSLILSFSLFTYENNVDVQNLPSGIGGKIFINEPGGPY